MILFCIDTYIQGGPLFVVHHRELCCLADPSTFPSGWFINGETLNFVWKQISQGKWVCKGI